MVSFVKSSATPLMNAREDSFWEIWGVGELRELTSEHRCPETKAGNAGGDQDTGSSLGSGLFQGPADIP